MKHLLSSLVIVALALGISLPARSQAQIRAHTSMLAFPSTTLAVNSRTPYLFESA